MVMYSETGMISFLLATEFTINYFLILKTPDSIKILFIYRTRSVVDSCGELHEMDMILRCNTNQSLY
jgi:hypothetical protein